MSTIQNLMRSDLKRFSAYSSARDEAKTGKIFLNANESPYPLVSENGEILNRYPEKQPKELIKLIASIYKISAEQVVLSRGSDEIIDLLVRLFCTAYEDSIIICPPTFGMYSVCAKLQGAKIIEVPLIKESKFELNTDLILSQYNPSVKIIFLCSPNNPTGNIINTESILNLCKQLKNKCIIAVDEAYIEFSDSESLSKYINIYDNLVILRTFSKAYRLAAARCGMMIAQPELVNWVLKIIPPYPIPSTTSALLFNALKNNGINMKEQIQLIKSEKIRLFKAFSFISYIKKTWESEANFLLIEVEDAEELMRIFSQNGVIIRNMTDKPNLKNCVRITIGLAEENNKLLFILKNMSVI